MDSVTTDGAEFWLFGSAQVCSAKYHKYRIHSASQNTKALVFLAAGL